MNDKCPSIIEEKTSSIEDNEKIIKFGYEKWQKMKKKKKLMEKYAMDVKETKILLKNKNFRTKWFCQI